MNQQNEQESEEYGFEEEEMTSEVREQEMDLQTIRDD